MVRSVDKFGEGVNPGPGAREHAGFGGPRRAGDSLLAVAPCPAEQLSGSRRMNARLPAIPSWRDWDEWVKCIRIGDCRILWLRPSPCVVASIERLVVVK